MRKRELVALLCLSSWCLLIVVWFFLTLPRVCQQLLSVVSPNQTHLLFLAYFLRSKFLISIFLGLQGNKYLFRYQDFVDIVLGSSQNCTSLRDHFYAF